MNETRPQLEDIEQEISAALTEGSQINEDQLMRLLDAYDRHNVKNDKISNMVLSVKLDENLKFECFLSAGNLHQVAKSLRGTIDVIQALRGQTGPFLSGQSIRLDE